MAYQKSDGANHLLSVTEIVGQIYPFPDFVKDRWIESINEELIALGKDPVSQLHLNQMTQNLGDMLHHYLIYKGMDYPCGNLHTEYKDFQNAIDSFLQEREFKGIWCEKEVVKKGEYVGHYDLYGEITWNGERIKGLFDVKTYRGYKEVLGIKDTSKKPKLLGNKGKVGLQISMYKDAFEETTGIKVGNLFCIHVKPDTCDLVQLPYNINKYETWKLQQADKELLPIENKVSHNEVPHAII